MPGTAHPQAPPGSHISAEICPNPLTDPAVFNLQDPQHGTYLVALALDFLSFLGPLLWLIPLLPGGCFLSYPLNEFFMVTSSFYSPSCPFLGL